MPLPHTLAAHAEICSDLYDLMLDENRFLKASGRSREEAFLNRKRAMLASLTRSLEAVREGAGHRGSPTPELRAAMEKVQQITLKALLLDRENEQLLFKAALQPKPAAAVAPARPVASQVERTYGKYR